MGRSEGKGVCQAGYSFFYFFQWLKPLVTACGWGVHAPETWGEVTCQPGCSPSRSRVGGASIRLKRGAGITPYAVRPGLSPSARFHAKTGGATGIIPLLWSVGLSTLVSWSKAAGQLVEAPWSVGLKLLVSWSKHPGQLV